MSTADPIQKNMQEVSRLQREVDNLQSQVRMTMLRDKIEDLQTSVSGLPQKIKELRNRNYAFDKSLDTNSTDLPRRWSSLKTSVNNEISRQSRSLEAAMRPLESKMVRLSNLKRSPSAATPLIRQLTSEINNLKGKVNAANRSIEGMFDQFESEVNAMNNQVRIIEEMLDNLEEASFALMPNEAGILAVKATFIEGKEDKGDPEGILFLTDQRLIFERKEKVAKKKVLFIATEKELVQEVLMDNPLGYVEEVKSFKRGLLKNEDHIEVSFEIQAAVRETHLHLYGQDCDDWKTAILRAKSGEYDFERAIEIDEEAAEAVRDVPTVCPGCGANIQQKVTRGMDSISCEYCGMVIRI